MRTLTGEDMPSWASAVRSTQVAGEVEQVTWPVRYPENVRSWLCPAAQEAAPVTVFEPTVDGGAEVLPQAASRTATATSAMRVTEPESLPRRGARPRCGAAPPPSCS